MKKILVPTDFSACANYAMEAAFLFAEKFNSKIQFVHIIEKTISGQELDQLIQNTELLFTPWLAKAKSLSIDLNTKISNGKFLSELKKEIAEYRADFIIMGSHGVSGKKEYFIGSNTQKAIRSIHLPFIILKQALEDIQFEKVVFASGFNTSDRDPYQYFLGLMEGFNPEIHLVSINTFNWFSQPYLVIKEAMADFKEMGKRFSIKCHFHSDLNIEAGIRHFSEKIGADLIVVSNLIRHPIKRILSGSTVEALINHSNLPVVSIDYPS